jgi:hypothetical protein
VLISIIKKLTISCRGRRARGYISFVILLLFKGNTWHYCKIIKVTMFWSKPEISKMVP